jgi:hypothetical protein
MTAELRGFRVFLAAGRAEHRGFPLSLRRVQMPNRFILPEVPAVNRIFQSEGLLGAQLTSDVAEYSISHPMM